MNYPAAALGSGIGMMIAFVVFANAWRIRLLPKEYDFIHEFGKALVPVGLSHSRVYGSAMNSKPVTYARENLFDPQGIAIGASHMWLKPHDMAKFGLLYLQKGQWDDGRQVVSADWIVESITPHAYPRTYVDILAVTK